MIWGVASEPLPHWSRQKALKMRWTFGNVFATFFLGAVGSRKNLDRYVALCLLYERWEGHVSYDPAWNVHFPHPHPHPLIEYVLYFELPKPSSLHRYIIYSYIFDYILKSYVWTTKVPKTCPHFPPPHINWHVTWKGTSQKEIAFANHWFSAGMFVLGGV